MSVIFMKKNKLTVPQNQSYDYVLPEMVKTAEEYAAGRKDLLLKNPKSNDLFLENPEELSFRFGLHRNTYQLIPYSRHQLCQKVGMPYGYFDRLDRSRSKELRNLACANMNMLFKYYTGSMLLRTVDNCLRGVLSPMYCSFDSDEILDVFTDCVGPKKELDPSNMLVQGYCNSMDVLHLRFTTARPVKTLTDDDLYYGLELTSSDVGKYSLSVRFFVYKQVCTNGMCLGIFDKALYTQRHVGINKDIFRAGLRNSLKAFPSLTTQATDLINHAGSVSLADNPLFDLDNNSPESVQVREKMQGYLGVGQENMAVIAKLARENYGTTLWAYGNAITEWAQQYEFERRKELELKAGRLMTDFYGVLAA